MEELKLGYEVGEACNRDGCKGTISKKYVEGNNNNNRFHTLWEIETDTYERVLEKGLLAALKLI